MGTMRVMDQSKGDFEVAWDEGDESSVENARNAFGDLRRKGFNVFRMTDGAKGEQMRDFDASAGKMLAIPPIAGG